MGWRTVHPQGLLLAFLLAWQKGGVDLQGPRPLELEEGLE